MRHASDGQILAYLDDELGSAQRSEVAVHLSACGTCVANLKQYEAISAEFREALSWLDVEVPLTAAQQRFAAARRVEKAEPGATVAPLRPARVLHGFGRSGLLKAAALAALLAGAASAAIPGSPVREWVEAALGLATVDVPVVEPVQTPAQPTPPAVAPATQEPVPDVLSRVPPERNRVEVKLREVEGLVVVRYVQEPGAAIRSANVDANHFSSPGVIEAGRLGSGDVYVDIQANVLEARVEVNGELYLLKRGDNTQTFAPIQERTSTRFSFPPRS